MASEMKALVDLCADVAEFPPGHVYDSGTRELTLYYSKPWRDYGSTRDRVPAPGTLRDAFEQAVHRQLMTDVPYGVLLSGGLDSSLVAACAARFVHGRIEDGDRSEAWWPRLHSFAIGLEGSPDLAAARIAAPTALLAATVAEWLATGTGLGNMMAVDAATSRYTSLWSTVVVVTLLALVAYAVVELIERRVLAVLAPEQGGW